MRDALHLTILLLGLAGVGLVNGCKEEGAFEKAGEKVDEAIEETGDAIEDAADEIEDATDSSP